MTYQPSQPDPADTVGNPPRRSWPARHKALTGLLAVVGLTAVYGIGTAGAPDTTPGHGLAAASSPAQKPPAQPAAELPDPVEQPKTWRTVATLSGASTDNGGRTGTADGQGTVFTLGDGPARLTYKVTDVSGYDLGIAAGYVMTAGSSLDVDGGIPEFLLGGESGADGSDSVDLTQGAGDYYLAMIGANIRWTLTVEQQS